MKVLPLLLLHFQNTGVTPLLPCPSPPALLGCDNPSTTHHHPDNPAAQTYPSPAFPTQRAEGGGPLLRPGSNGGDIGGDYAFAKYNKKVDMLQYNDEEYELYCSSDPSWRAAARTAPVFLPPTHPSSPPPHTSPHSLTLVTVRPPLSIPRTRAETDYLFDLCLRLDLRFIVIADRYEWPNVTRTVEDLKARYYGIAQRLVEARADFPEQAAAHPVCAEPFNAAHERERKEDLAALLSRSAAREREETELLAKAAEIEAARKVEMEAARAAGKAFGFGSRASGRFPDLRPDHAPLVDIDQDPGGPMLATAQYSAERPPPGVFARGMHTIAVANEVAVRERESPAGVFAEPPFPPCCRRLWLAVSRPFSCGR